MSKFDLRDISERLESSADTEAVVFEFIGYLQALHADWRAALAFYEVSSDSLVNLYERQGDRLTRREITVPVDQLPARLVRKFFHPSAFFNAAKHRSVLGHWFRSSPFYEPEQVDAPALQPLVPLSRWQSCACVPLADRDDILAMLVIASDKKHAFGGNAMNEIIPVKSIASLALAHHLHRASWNGGDRTETQEARSAAAEFQDRVKQLSQQAHDLEQDNRAKAEQLDALAGEVQVLDRSSSEYKHELDRVKGTLTALEEQTVVATQHLNDAYVELNELQSRLSESEHTIVFMKEVFHLLSREHARDQVPATLVSWLSQQFGIERCSLMVLDESGETLRIAAQCGIDPAIADRIKVRVGQGVAGWVAYHKKPLYVRVRDEVPPVERTVKETYNSDSFISVPLVHNDRVHGVLSFSNKRDGEPFDVSDLDRALLVGSVVAMNLGDRKGGEMDLRAAA